MTTKLIARPYSDEDLERFTEAFVEEVSHTGGMLARTSGGREHFEKHGILAEPRFLSHVIKTFQGSHRHSVFEWKDGMRGVNLMHAYGRISIHASTHPVLGYATNRPWMWSVMPPRIRDIEKVGPPFREAVETSLRTEVALYMEAFGWQPPPVLNVYIPILLATMESTFQWGSLNPPELANKVVDIRYLQADFGGDIYLARYEHRFGAELSQMFKQNGGTTTYRYVDPDFKKREGDW